MAKLQAAKQGTVAGSPAVGNVDRAHWLLPIEDRRQHTNAKPASHRKGMLESFPRCFPRFTPFFLDFNYRLAFASASVGGDSAEQTGATRHVRIAGAAEQTSYG